MKRNFFEAVENRRSQYALSAESPVSDERIREIVETAVKHAPSPFHSQAGRVVILRGEEHKALWNIVLETLRAIVPPESFHKTQAKVGGFAAAYGTLLFFEDQEIVEGLQKAFPDFYNHFPVWSEHATGILQYICWTALEDEGLGASLQHYNPLIDEAVKARWDLPKSWKLNAQMPFGKVVAPPQAKEFKDLRDRVLVKG